MAETQAEIHIGIAKRKQVAEKPAAVEETRSMGEFELFPWLLHGDVAGFTSVDMSAGPTPLTDEEKRTLDFRRGKLRDLSPREKERRLARLIKDVYADAQSYPGLTLHVRLTAKPLSGKTPVPPFLLAKPPLHYAHRTRVPWFMSEYLTDLILHDRYTPSNLHMGLGRLHANACELSLLISGVPADAVLSPLVWWLLKMVTWEQVEWSRCECTDDTLPAAEQINEVVFLASLPHVMHCFRNFAEEVSEHRGLELWKRLELHESPFIWRKDISGHRTAVQIRARKLLEERHATFDNPIPHSEMEKILDLPTSTLSQALKDLREKDPTVQFARRRGSYLVEGKGPHGPVVSI